MSWDKRATQRRPDAAQPSRKAGMYIVYLGLTEDAERKGVAEGSSLRVGDAFRLLPRAAITFGRSELCEVTIDSGVLSQAHAMVTFLPGDETRLALVDLMSRKGTWVSGRGSPVQIIAAGAEFALAKAFRFRCQPAS